PYMSFLKEREAVGATGENWLFFGEKERKCEAKEVEIPKFSFEKGERYYDGEKLKINGKNVLVIEGIHALNPKLTSLVSDEVKFKIYISALTSISIDGHNRVRSTDNRLIRRIVRDHR
ncbi:hypothetical protein DLK05_17825, partial [Ancylomarina longa]